MVSALDVASYILERCGPMTAMKLQKLVYYSQAWSLVWDEQPMFSDRIEAWASGPVIPNLYNAHRGEFIVTQIAAGNPKNLNQKQKETIQIVLKFYGEKPAQWLSDLTHNEKPWQEAREGLNPTERSNHEISLASMEEYYSSLPPAK